MDYNQILVGKIITAVHLAKDKKAIKFDIDGGEPIIARTDGDCCSNSWIENVENAKATVGTAVTGTADIDMPERDHPEDKDREWVIYYGFRISTNNGDCVIDYRNESNGYYGGNLSWPGERFYGGVYGQNQSEDEWEKIA